MNPAKYGTLKTYPTTCPATFSAASFEVAVSGELDDLKAESINEFDLVLFYGSGGNFSDPAQEQGLDQFVKKGGGIVGVHATDAACSVCPGTAVVGLRRLTT